MDTQRHQLPGDPFGVVTCAFRALVQDGGTPFADAALAAINGSDWQALTRLKIHPRDYPCFATFRKDYQIAKLLSKFPGLTSPEVLRETAYRSFREAEKRCRDANRKLMTEPLGAAECILSDARRKISGILGPLRLVEVFSAAEWGPGATSTIRAFDATVDKKTLEFPMSVTTRALGYAAVVMGFDIHWMSARLAGNGHEVWGPCSAMRTEFLVRDDCVVTTVPKDSKTDRTIGMEATMNTFLQKGVGKFLRKRLRYFGIDLDNQDHNRLAAFRAVDELLATLDLSQASDSVCVELVRLLFPTDWFELLYSLRSPQASIGDETLMLEKFSSMGNGFTFELETLIFFALASACAEEVGDPYRPLVYGDDIIVSQRIAPRVISILECVGFTLNHEKSFTEGDFFESCGGHYHSGRDVTPMYQKEPVTSVESLIRFGNRLLRLAVRWGYGVFAHNAFLKAYSIVRSCLKSLIRKDAIDFLHASGCHPSSFSVQLRRLGRLPLKPFGVEGDDALDSIDDQFAIDQNGFVRIRVLSVHSVRREANHAALLATAIRRGYKPSTIGDKPWYSATPFETALEPFLGMVSVRGDTYLHYGFRKPYVGLRESPSWG